MKIILDTNQLVWAISSPLRLRAAARRLIEDADNDVMISVVCVWEVGIKYALGRADFDVEPRALLDAADEMGLRHLPLQASAAIRVVDLPDLHRDPFDRILVAQAIDEDALLLTADHILAGYGPHVRLIA